MTGPGSEQPSGRFSPRLIGLIAVSIAVSLPAILGGHLLDDYWRYSTSFHQPDGPFGYYRVLEWWLQSVNVHWWGHPEIAIRRLDPLASLSLFLDYRVWGGNPLFGHLQSLVWWLVMMLGALGVLRRLLPARAVLWAFAAFVLAEYQHMPLGWISARLHVQAGALSFWALLFYLRWRDEGGGRLLGVSLLLWVLGLASGESAIGLAGFLLAYELLGRSEAWKRRLQSLAPVLGIGLAYLVMYAALGYGVRHAAPAYLNPLLEPGAYLAGLLPKLLTMLGVYSFGIPGMLRMFPGPIAHVPIAAGLLGIGLLVAAGYRARERITPEHATRLRWLALAIPLAMLPALSSNAMDGRETLLSGLAHASLAGLLLRLLLDLPRGLGRLALAGAICAGLFFFAPLLRLGESASFNTLAKTQQRVGENSRIECAQGARAFLINGDFPLALYAPYILAHHQGLEVASWRLLFDPQADVVMERSDENTLVFRSDKTLIAEMLTLGVALDAGKVIDRGDLRVTVLERKAEGPTRVRVEIDDLAVPARTCLLYYQDGIIQPAPLPAVGASLQVPLEMAMMPVEK